MSRLLDIAILSCLLIVSQMGCGSEDVLSPVDVPTAAAEEEVPEQTLVPIIAYEIIESGISKLARKYQNICGGRRGVHLLCLPGEARIIFSDSCGNIEVGPVSEQGFEEMCP